jgi:hypothetical protein
MNPEAVLLPAIHTNDRTTASLGVVLSRCNARGRARAPCLRAGVQSTNFTNANGDRPLVFTSGDHERHLKTAGGYHRTDQPRNMKATAGAAKGAREETNHA